MSESQPVTQWAAAEPQELQQAAALGPQQARQWQWWLATDTEHPHDQPES